MPLGPYALTDKIKAQLVDGNHPDADLAASLLAYHVRGLPAGALDETDAGVDRLCRQFEEQAAAFRARKVEAGNADDPTLSNEEARVLGR